MPASTSQSFAALVDPHRDRLYGLALAHAGDPSHAEGLLQQVLRQAFVQYTRNETPADLPGFLEAQIVATAGTTTAANGAGAVMPAATWARLYGALQIEAARLGATRNLNPDSVLLSADPLLAPKKHVPPDDFADFRLSPTARFVIVVIALLVVGIVLTVFFSSHRTPATRPAPATSSATEPH